MLGYYLTLHCKWSQTWVTWLDSPRLIFPIWDHNSSSLKVLSSSSSREWIIDLPYVLTRIIVTISSQQVIFKFWVGVELFAPVCYLASYPEVFKFSCLLQFLNSFQKRTLVLYQSSFLVYTLRYRFENNLLN